MSLFVSVCLRQMFGCTMALTSLYTLFFSYISPVLPLLFLHCGVCSSVQLHSALDGDGEYLLLEECESKTVTPQSSLWVAGHPGAACLCGVLESVYEWETRRFTWLVFIISVDFEVFAVLAVLGLNHCTNSTLACMTLFISYRDV